jgi:hypothetical protein
MVYLLLNEWGLETLLRTCARRIAMLSSIPGKDGGHRKVKDGANNRSRHPGEPPDRIRREGVGRYADVGDDTEAASNSLQLTEE